jgi:hypothetical protein
MRLNWRDGITTLLAGLVAIIYVAFTEGWAIPVVDDARGATLLLGVVGLSMCVVGGSASTIASANVWTAPLGILGVASLALVVAGLITGWVVAVPLLAAVIALMWAISTARHAFAARTPQHT